MTDYFFENFRGIRGMPIWQRYALTVLISGGAGLLQYLVFATTRNYQFIFLLLGVFLCAFLFNRKSGCYAVLISAIAATALLISSAPTSLLSRAGDMFSLISFILIALLIALVTETMREAIEKLSDANARLAESESQKDFLLREASHRMLNDLHMVSGLVEIEKSRVHDVETARSALDSTVDRLNLIGRVQTRLRRIDQTLAVDLHDFIMEFSEDIKKSLLAGRPIVLDAEVDRCIMPQQKAVAVGLVLHEMLTNAVKYAFPEGAAGHIRIRFRAGEGRFRLTVEDNGIGLGKSAKRGTGLGGKLIKSMAELLKGSAGVKPGAEGGTTAELEFPAPDNEPPQFTPPPEQPPRDAVWH